RLDCALGPRWWAQSRQTHALRSARRELLMPDYPVPPDWVLIALRDGMVIPAHPLALTAARKLDEHRQVALTRYYLAAGAGGVAVGVHTTQFTIRNPKHSLLRPVLEIGRAHV